MSQSTPLKQLKGFSKQIGWIFFNGQVTWFQPKRQNWGQRQWNKFPWKHGHGASWVHYRKCEFFLRIFSVFTSTVWGTLQLTQTGIVAYSTLLACTFVWLQYVIHPRDTVPMDLANISEQALCLKLQTHWDASTTPPSIQLIRAGEKLLSSRKTKSKILKRARGELGEEGWLG